MTTTRARGSAATGAAKRSATATEHVVSVAERASHSRAGMSPAQKAALLPAQAKAVGLRTPRTMPTQAKNAAARLRRTTRRSGR